MSDRATSSTDPHRDHTGSPGVLSGDIVQIGGLGDDVLHGGHELLTFLHGVDQNIISDFRKDDQFNLGGHTINPHDLASDKLGNGVGSLPSFNQPVPIGTPLSLQFIGSALLFLPELLGITGR